MGQKQQGKEENKSKQDSHTSENNQTSEKSEHMIEVLKKENSVLKDQIISLNKKSPNTYDTLLSMLEVLNMQREKIQSIFEGKYFY